MRFLRWLFWLQWYAFFGPTTEQMDIKEAQLRFKRLQCPFYLKKNQK